MNQTVGITAELFNAIVNYLVTRPYGEVANMIGGLNQAAQAVAAQSSNVVDAAPASSEPQA